MSDLPNKKIKFKLIKHFITITHHRHLVIGLCFKCGIGFQGLFHDLSKYSFAEFIPGVKYYQGTKSPQELERRIEGRSLAWMHHKGRNKHHFEYWYDYSEAAKTYVPIKMPLKYVKEMFCDRVAASKNYNKKKYTTSAPYEYYVDKKAEKMLHPDTAQLLRSWLEILKDQGEKVACKIIRKTKKY